MVLRDIEEQKKREQQAKIKQLLDNFKNCWYDIVGSSESFMTEKDKYDYCKKIVEQEHE